MKVILPFLCYIFFWCLVLLHATLGGLGWLLEDNHAIDGRLSPANK